MQREQPHRIVPEKAIPPHEDHKYLRLTSSEKAVLKSKTREERGAWMRAHMPTSEVLARWLENKGLRGLGARARGGEFDLNRSKHANPRGELCSVLDDAGLVEEATIVSVGTFDPTDYETEQWAQTGPTTRFLEDLPHEAQAIRGKQRSAGPEDLRAAYGGKRSPGIKPGDTRLIEGTPLHMRVTDVREEDDGQGGTYPAVDAVVEPCDEAEDKRISPATNHPQTGLNP